MKKAIALLLLCVAFFGVLSSHVSAADIVATSDPVVSVAPAADFGAVVGELAAKFPVVMSILSLMGLLRVAAKPVFMFYESYVSSTESKEDDERLNHWRASWWFKTIAFVLNWTASIPLKTK